ncbi:unnamed protein product [Ranitomeya imitator]|uniref:Catalase core domain-containing protein n=1 Tax=Ranitomeya imitator TaxID=111125 RepID=A0ABN9KXR0_9NEOB|nr:unnamed protein product [Ranitomeya imitator]
MAGRCLYSAQFQKSGKEAQGAQEPINGQCLLVAKPGPIGLRDAICILNFPEEHCTANKSPYLDKPELDNDHNHTSRLCKGYLTKKESDGVLRQMTWPSQSPDLNPIGMPELMTTSNGDPIGNLTASLTVGPRGPVLLQDAIFIEEISHFVRERIPERVVHARGAGAFGCFEVTHDITKYCKAQMFQYVGKKTPVAVRFSTTTGETGTSELVRDPRGFAVKFYTQQGNWDIVGNNTPIFFIRDPILFPSLSHAQKRNPQTHRKDPNMLWDFLSLRPESLHEVTHLFSDKGIPDGYRHMDGFSNHAFKLVNAQGEAVFAKFQWTSNQGLKNLPRETAKALAAKKS